LSAIRTDLSVGDTLNIDDGRIRVTLESKSGSRARIKVQAEGSISIGVDREENATKERLKKPIPA
jgi:pyruvate kinase